MARRRMGLIACLVLVVAAFTALSAASAAFGYWDFSGSVVQYGGYSENISNGWGTRLSRQYCGSKIDAWDGNQWYLQGSPNGCADSDYSLYMYGFYASMCYNVDGPTMWINCRIDPSL